MAESLTVVIATAGRSALLDRTLQSITSCCRPREYKATIVVENGLQAGAETVVRKYADTLNARYLFSPEANKSTALNVALEQLSDTLVVFFDDDVRLAPGTLMAYRDAASGREKGKMYGGPVDVDYEVTPQEWIKRYLPVSARGWGLNGIEKEPKVRFLGANWAAFSNDLVDAGGFNPCYGPGNPNKGTGQETEMQHRLQKMGVEKEFVPGALVWHYVPRERCSPEWILKRVYRDGLSHGSRLTPSPRTIIGLEPWMYTEWAYLATKLVVKSAMGKKMRFGGFRHYLFHKGLMDGYRRARLNGHK